MNISQGAHIGEEQKIRAEQGITKIKSRFLLLDVLREDKFGAVYLYQLKEKNNLLIIKKKASTSPGFEASNLLASLEHDNVVNTLGTSRNENFFILVQEYLSGGTLQDKLAFQLDWKEILSISKQICQAVIFAHNNRIVHGHIRPTNILFTADGQLKVTDFALKDDTSTVENAHFYRLQDEERSQATDIYAIGVILYQLFTGCLPRRKNDTGFVIRKLFTKLPSDIQELIVNMLSTVPENRQPDSLQHAVTIMDKHIRRKRNKSFTERPLRDKNRASDRHDDGIRGSEFEVTTVMAAARNHPDHRTRMNLLFALLVVIFAQYLFIFDGQEKINQSMPSVYSSVVNKFEGLVGRINVRGTSSIENRRLY